MSDETSKTGALEASCRCSKKRAAGHRRLSQRLVVALSRLDRRLQSPPHRRRARSTVRRCRDTPKRASTSAANAAPDVDGGYCRK
jgi:hypothetical protein